VVHADAVLGAAARESRPGLGKELRPIAGRCHHDLKPHPCGYAGDPKRVCRCSYDQVRRYRARPSGPVIARFDLHVQLPPVPVSALHEAANGEPTERVRKRVEAARAAATARNAETRRRRDEADLSEPARQLLHRSMDVLGLWLRAYTKVRVSRTLVDLEGCDAVSSSHVAEAVQYRHSTAAAAISGAS
jgi:magnesium chelatase family protein